MSTHKEKEETSASTEKENTGKSCESSKAAKATDEKGEPSKTESMNTGPQEEESQNETTQKHEKFLKGKLGNKSVLELPGIGKIGAGYLENKGINMAYKVLAHFLLCDKKEKEFTEWLRGVNPAANSRHQKACYDALKQLCEKDLD